MVNNLLHIKINSSEANKDSGFYTLMVSGASVVCLKNEEYIVPEKVIAKLNEKKIIYELVVETNKNDLKESNLDATETEV
tara:strand:- start:331 stop:570 length:240 start_codon:yes stop_codon:yes gene_type:complete